MHRANWQLTTGNCFFMNVAIFGGTFDPVHRGHLAVARAAQQAFKLGRIYFVPADIPPHKQRQPVTPFYHRYAMLALALKGEPRFVPSLIEAPSPLSSHSGRKGGVPEARRAPSYSIDTVRKFRALLPKRDRLFFIIGIDAFLDIATWRKPEELLREVEFIVVSRPGFSMAEAGSRLQALSFKNTPTLAKTGLGRSTRNIPQVHLLEDVAEKASSTKVRAAASGRAAKGLLDEAVVEYIRKEHLYVRK
jgi:nicotinate-nucleotide adenylyltransferase